MKAIIAWLFRCRHTRSNIWIDMVSNRVSHTCLDCDAVREEGGDWGMKPGFYWVRKEESGRLEVAEFDGQAWSIGDGSGNDLHWIGERINEPFVSAFLTCDCGGKIKPGHVLICNKCGYQARITVYVGEETVPTTRS